MKETGTEEGWHQVKARDLKVGDRIIRNVQPGFEWSPGPYGAFIIESLKAYGDEFRFVASYPYKDTTDHVKFSYDGDEEVTVG